VGISRRKLGGQKTSRRRKPRGKMNGEGRGMERGCPLPSRLEGLEPRPRTGFGAFWALKTHLLTSKLSIFDIFVTYKNCKCDLWGLHLTPKTNKQAQLGGLKTLSGGLNPPQSPRQFPHWPLANRSTTESWTLGYCCYPESGYTVGKEITLQLYYWTMATLEH